MARVSLKKDFKDGDKLYGQQLNNNFGAIEAALDAMNKIVWQDDPDDMVTTFRGTTEEIQDKAISDGQLLYDITTGETYIDYNGERISTGSGNAIHIGEDEPTNAATQLWVDPTESINVIGSEIESGSNENGNWVKYSDGTMICYNTIRGNNFNCTSNVGAGAYYYTDTNNNQENVMDWNYPQEFIESSRPLVSVSVSSSAFTNPCIGQYNSRHAMGLCTTSYAAPDIYFTWHSIAIGRWK